MASKSAQVNRDHKDIRLESQLRVDMLVNPAPRGKFGYSRLASAKAQLLSFLLRR